MELLKEILAKIIEKENINITFSNSEIDIAAIIESTCYNALQKIKSVIEDDSLSDKECFTKIEEIICIFETIGSDGGFRHDFG